MKYYLELDLPDGAHSQRAAEELNEWVRHSFAPWQPQSNVVCTYMGGWDGVCAHRAHTRKESRKNEHLTTPVDGDGESKWRELTEINRTVTDAALQMGGGCILVKMRAETAEPPLLSMSLVPTENTESLIDVVASFIVLTNEAMELMAKHTQQPVGLISALIIQRAMLLQGLRTPVDSRSTIIIEKNKPTPPAGDTDAPRRHTKGE